MEKVLRLASNWRDEAKIIAKRGDERVALVLRQLADEVTQAVRAEEDEPLTLAEASRVSGFSADHLGRLIRDGSIPNAGRRGSPRIRRGDVPLKAPGRASHVARSQLRADTSDTLFQGIVATKFGGA